MISIDEAARPATASDIDVIDALVGEAIAEISTRRGGAMWVRRDARVHPAADELRAALDDPDRHVIVGTIDGVVVGYAVLQRAGLHDGTDVAILDDVYVLPDARGVGVGEAMLDLGIEWSRSRGCVGIDSFALPGDRDTKNFFESFGLVARAIIVHRHLGER